MTRYSNESSGNGFISLIVYLMVAIYFFFPGCSQNAMTKYWGDDMSLKIPCDQKLVTISWDNTDLYYTTRPMVAGDLSVESTLQGKVNWYIFFDTGTVTIKECGEAPELIQVGEPQAVFIVPS